MRLFPKLAAIGCTVVLGACFHATIETGLPPSPQVIDEPWASSFVYGLVPPKTVETMAKCPNGVSKVETQHTFLNGLVAALTLSIFTPMQIRVTCAAGGHAAIPSGAPAIQLGQHPSAAEMQQALAAAAAQSVAADAPVYLEF
jgi:hypothetical protein